MDARNYAESFIQEMGFFFFLNKEQLKCFKIMCFTFSSRCRGDGPKDWKEDTCLFLVLFLLLKSRKK